MSYDEQLVREGKCPELVMVSTEDGWVDGRCMQPVVGPDGFACEGHTAEILSWSRMSEVEKLDWERRQDEQS